MASTLSTSEATPLAPAQAALKRTGPRRKGPYPYWFLIIPGVIYVVFFVVPTLTSFYFSFTRWDLFSSHWIGLENYQTFFAEQALVIGLRNTLIYAVITSGLKVVLGMALAVLLTSRIIARGYLRSVIFFPVLVSTIGVGLTFTVLMNPEKGLINNVLAHVGVDGPGWLTNPSLAIFSVALVDVWKGVGLATVIYIAGLVSIAGEYNEAAQVDGASRFRQHLHVTVPMLSNVTFFNLVMGIIGSLQVFAEPFVLTGGKPNNSTLLLPLYLYQNAFTYLKMGYASAIAWVTFAMILLLTLVVFKSLPFWVHTEAGDER